MTYREALKALGARPAEAPLEGQPGSGGKEQWCAVQAGGLGELFAPQYEPCLGFREGRLCSVYVKVYYEMDEKSIGVPIGRRAAR